MSYPVKLYPRDYKVLSIIDYDAVSIRYDAVHASSGVRTILHVGFASKMIASWDVEGTVTGVPTEVSLSFRLADIQGLPRIFGYGRISADVVFYATLSYNYITVKTLVDAGAYLNWDRCECFRQVFYCVYECAKRGVYHTALSPHCVFFNENQYQVGGWRFGDVSDVSGATKTEVFTASNKDSRSPEAHRTDKYAGMDYCPEKQLVWSLGIFLYSLYLSSILFERSELECVGNLVRNVMYNKVKREVTIIQDLQSRLVGNTCNLPRDVRMLIWKCLAFFPEKRQSLETTKYFVDRMTLEK
ncbi:uncharacterized protein LOC121048571 [Ixodes scapularis]|uniref:uncharacterized protein LOC121048571 n=1 Tax=Ixodes scapularis TaxID=6945 RepID=UPI001A9D4D2D|nr:uncharacterized protein LOC121048571 [Ixodes scapularis]